MKHTISLAAIALVSSVSAWSQYEHMMVADIAAKHITSSKMAEAEKLLAVFSGNKKEGNYPFVECAGWPDDIKVAGGGYQKNWHFNDNPIFNEGGDAKSWDFTRGEYNVDGAIDGIIGWFNKKRGYENDIYYKAIHKSGFPSKFHNEAGFKSIALRYLIHYVGDAHQPLHNVAEVNSKTPTGDRGGNEFNLKSHYGSDNLHSVWDHTIYEFHGKLDIPFSKAGFSAFEQDVTGVVGRQTHVTGTTDLNTNHWSAETVKIASTLAYPLAQKFEGTSLPDSYVAATRPVAENQLVKAGLRLANIINNLDMSIPKDNTMMNLNTYSEVPVHQIQGIPAMLILL